MPALAQVSGYQQSSHNRTQPTFVPLRGSNYSKTSDYSSFNDSLEHQGGELTSGTLLRVNTFYSDDNVFKSPRTPTAVSHPATVSPTLQLAKTKSVDSADGNRTTLNKLKVDIYSISVNMASKMTGAFELENFKVEAVSPTGRVIKISGDGHYMAPFSVDEIGRWSVAMFYKGKYLDGCPVEVSDPSQIRVLGLGSGFVGKEVTFYVDCRKAGPGKLGVDISHRGQPVSPHISATLTPAYYKVTFLPEGKGAYEINVQFNKAEVREGDTESVNPDERQRRVVFFSQVEPKQGYVDVKAMCNWEIDYLTARPIICNVNDTSGVLVYGMEDEAVCSVPEIIADCTHLGGGNISAEVWYKQGRYPCAVHEDMPGIYRIGFVPRGSGEYKTWVFYEGQPLKGSPYIQHIKELEKPRVEGEGLYGGELGKPAMFTVDPKGLSGQISVTVQGPSKTVNNVLIEKDVNQHFQVTYRPVEAGRHEVQVKFNGQHVEGSPFQASIVAPSVVRFSDGWKPLLDKNIISLQVSKERTLAFDVSLAGPGVLTAHVLGPEGPIPVKVEAKNKGTKCVVFTPRVEGRHIIHVNWCGQPLSDSPFHGYAVSTSGTAGTSSQPDNADFQNFYRGHTNPDFVQSSPLNQKHSQSLQVARSSSNATHTQQEAHNLFLARSSSYATHTQQEAHNLFQPYQEQSSKNEVKKSTEAQQTSLQVIPSTPKKHLSPTTSITQTPHFLSPCAQSSRTQPPAPSPDSKPVSFLPIASIAPETNTSFLNASYHRSTPAEDSRTEQGKTIAQRSSQNKLSAPSPNSEPVSFLPIASIAPGTGAGSMNRSDPHSTPAKDSRTGQEKPRGQKVILSGKGIQEAEVAKLAYFLIDTTHSYSGGRPSIHLQGEKENIPVTYEKLQPGIYRCSYVASSPGSYLLYVKLNNTPVKGSPFKVNVKEEIQTTITPLIVNATERSQTTNAATKGDNKQQELNSNIILKIDNKYDGAQLMVNCTDPLGFSCPCRLQDHHDGTKFLKLIPTVAGRYRINILYQGNPIQGSPFSVDIEESQTKPPVRVWGPGIESGVLPTFQGTFTVDATGAESGDVRLQVAGPKGGYHVKVRKVKDKIFQCSYDPVKPGIYTISVQWAELHVAGSPFTVLLALTPKELQAMQEEQRDNSWGQTDDSSVLSLRRSRRLLPQEVSMDDIILY